MSKLKLTTRLNSMNETHGRFTVFQNGGNAGQLCVDAEHAEAIVGLIAAAPELLEACKIALQCEQCKYGNEQSTCPGHADGELPCSGFESNGDPIGNVILRNAIKKAEGGQ